ncbi:MAG TPA: hypothetical protein VE172_23570, partial [Stackebrandtia sp.]
MRARRRLRLLDGHSSPQWTNALPIAWRRLETAIDGDPRRLVLGIAAASAVLVLPLGGPVAAGVCGCYVAAATLLWRAHRASRTRAASRHRMRGDIAMLAAELRAGVAPGDLLAAACRRLSISDDPLC